MQLLLEYLPFIAFFIAYKFADIYWATGVLIAFSVAQLIFTVITKKEVPTKQWVFLGLIVVFGGLTILLRDDTFIKWKVSIINLLFAVALLFSDYVLKKNLIKKLLEENIPLPDQIWRKLNLAWAVFFTTCAILNLYVAFNFDQDTWVNFKVFGLTGMTLVFAVLMVFGIYKHIPEEEMAALEAKEKAKSQE